MANFDEFLMELASFWGSQFWMDGRRDRFPFLGFVLLENIFAGKRIENWEEELGENRIGFWIGGREQGGKRRERGE